MRLLSTPWLMAKGPLLLCLLCLVLFSSHIAWQSYLWFDLKGQTAPQSPIAASQSTIDPQAIAELFQGPTVNPEVAQAGVTDLTLNGIFVHSDPTKSSALIAPTGGNTQRYSQGQRVGENTYIRAIYRDYVEIERLGRTEFLRFPKATLSHEIENEQKEHDQRIQVMEALREQMEAAHATQDDPSLTNMAMESE